MKNNLRKAVTFFAYPALLAATLLVIGLAGTDPQALQRLMLAYLLGLILVLIALERAFPLSPGWGMTRASFLRDLKYLLSSALAIGLVRWGFGALAIALNARYRGPLENASSWLAVPAFLAAFEFVQYWFHRLTHEGTGPLAGFLWKAHAAHHMPDRVYVLMHGVFHPVNAILSAVIIQALMLSLGLSPHAAFAAMLLIDLQSLVSHFNVDIRAGLLNHAFAGTELHRYHHSTRVAEARNYGVVLTLWDRVFGTFHYRPGNHPARLGLDGTGEYPDSRDFWRVLALPFRRRAGFTGKVWARTAASPGIAAET